MDGAPADWATLKSGLSSGDPVKYAELFGFPRPDQFDEKERTRYESVLTQWTAAGVKVAGNLDQRTRGGSYLLARINNKLKHGLLVSAVWQDGRLWLVFYPEATNTNPNPHTQHTVQEVTSAFVEHFVIQTYAVSKLLAATLLQFFAFQFGREANVQ